MHGARVAETQLLLGGMGVHIHFARIDDQRQHIGRMASTKQHIAIAHLHGIEQQLVAHGALVHEPVRKIGLRTRIGGLADPAGEPQRSRRHIDLHAARSKVLAQHGGQTLALRSGVGSRRHTQLFAAIAHMADAHIEARQRQPLHHAQHMHGFGGFAAQEAAPRRHIEEEITDFDHRAFGQRSGTGP